MEEYLRKCSAYVSEHPLDMYSEDVHTILDALFWAYCEAAGTDNENVQQGYDTLQQQLQCLSAQDVNTIINTVTDLCWEHDRQGSINGFRMGMRLKQELSQ